MGPLLVTSLVPDEHGRFHVFDAGRFVRMTMAEIKLQVRAGRDLKEWSER